MSLALVVAALVAPAWLYVVARVVTRAIVRTLGESEGLNKRRS